MGTSAAQPPVQLAVQRGRLHSLLGVKKVVIRLGCANSRAEEGIQVNTHQVGFMNAQLVFSSVHRILIGLVLPIADLTTKPPDLPGRHKKAKRLSHAYLGVAIRESP
jgi:hypothetical protein